MKLKNSRASRLLKTLSKELRVLFVICLANLAICLRTSVTQFSATTSISTLEPITGRKSETAIPRNIDGSRIGKTIRRSRYQHKAGKLFQNKQTTITKNREPKPDLFPFLREPSFFNWPNAVKQAACFSVVFC